MRISFEIGELEKHIIDFEFNQLFGRTTIRIDGRDIMRNVRLFSEPLQDSHEFDVGEKESFVIRIEKQRRLLFTSKYRVFINRRLFAVQQVDEYDPESVAILVNDRDADQPKRQQLKFKGSDHAFNSWTAS